MRTIAWIALALSTSACLATEGFVFGDASMQSDAQAGDLSADTSDAISDASDDTIVDENACANGPIGFVYDSTMVVCPAGSPVDQCNANDVCNKSIEWEACHPSEFIARGGATKTWPKPAWILGCVRDFDPPGSMDIVFNPVRGACSNCSMTTNGVLADGFHCNGSGSATSSHDLSHVGIATSVTCNRVGPDLAANEGFWAAVPSPTKLNHVVCCKRSP